MAHVIVEPLEECTGYHEGTWLATQVLGCLGLDASWLYLVALLSHPQLQANEGSRQEKSFHPCSLLCSPLPMG